MNSIYLERDYCEKCLITHWVEVQFKPDMTKRIICHGENFYPEDTKTHYVKSAHNGGKGFYLCKKSKHWQPPEAEPLPLIWEMAKDANVPADVDF